jgi:hypothetical protein
MQMVKKIKQTSVFKASLSKNIEKGGAWLCHVSTETQDPVSKRELVTYSQLNAFLSSSAAKRWIKIQVQALTPRKSVKMIAGEGKDAKGKPTSFVGVVTFKSE